jgi:hypothetical protein
MVVRQGYIRKIGGSRLSKVVIAAGAPRHGQGACGEGSELMAVSFDQLRFVLQPGSDVRVFDTSGRTFKGMFDGFSEGALALVVDGSRPWFGRRMSFAFSSVMRTTSATARATASSPARHWASWPAWPSAEKAVLPRR